MTGIRYLTGDATSPQAKGPKVIAHLCNDRGGWGKGVVPPSPSAGRNRKPATAVAIRYDAVRQCLRALAPHATRLAAGVHLPRIDTGLAGGRWDRVDPLVLDELAAHDIPVTVYDRS